MTPEEWDDERFAQSYWAGAIVVMVVLVLMPVGLMSWADWPQEQAVTLVGLVLVGWVLLATAVYVPWARARRRKRRGGRRR